MKKNRMMRIAAVLLIAVLLSTSVISGTFAKYTTSAEDTDSARVARWGFKENTITIKDLFKPDYDESVVSNNGEDVIAPGTKGSDTIAFVPAAGIPEVDYSIEVKAKTSVVDTSTNTIFTNENITWALYKAGEEASATWGTFDALMTAIEGLSEAKVEANNLPKLNDTYVIAWQWEFETDDDANVVDTGMGNADSLEKIDITITITATQLD